MDDKISVIMGIYNCGSTLKQAIESIQKQTYSNWELIICDDGSTDNTYEIAEQMAQTDQRIILLRNDSNQGLNVTLNNCLKHATGQFIARMDGDDDCWPDRFEKQLQFLKTHKEYGIVGTAMIFFDERGEWGRNYLVSEPQPRDIVAGSPICHATVMMRKKCMDDVSGYTEDRKLLRVEDVNLWIKLYAAGYRCYNLTEPLYRMRNDYNAANRRKYIYRINETYARLQGCKMLHLGPKYVLIAIFPLFKGLFPARIRVYIRKKQQQRSTERMQ